MIIKIEYFVYDYSVYSLNFDEYYGVYGLSFVFVYFLKKIIVLELIFIKDFYFDFDGLESVFIKNIIFEIISIINEVNIIENVIFGKNFVESEVLYFLVVLMNDLFFRMVMLRLDGLIIRLSCIYE